MDLEVVVVDMEEIVEVADVVVTLEAGAVVTLVDVVVKHSSLMCMSYTEAQHEYLLDRIVIKEFNACETFVLWVVGL